MKGLKARMGRPSRREAGILLPLGLLTLGVLSTFTLISYRGAVSLLLEERRVEAEVEARRLSAELSERSLPLSSELDRYRGRARTVAILDPNGELLAASSDSIAPQIPDPDGVSATADLRLAGRPGGRIAGRAAVLRVDLPAVALRSSERGLGILTPVVVIGDVAVTLLLIFYFHHLLSPWDRLLRRARESGRMSADADEADFLLRIFDEALETLSAAPRAAADSDLDALEQTLTRSIESGVLLLDPGGTVLALNEIGARLLAVDRPPDPGLPVGELLRDRPELRRVFLAAVAEQRGVERGDYPLGENGRTLGLTVHALHRDDGHLRGFLALFIDLTVASEQAEQRRLAESLAQVGELAAGVAHEMRNSLATLRGYLALAERRSSGGTEAGDEYLGELRRETDHLKRVVDDFLSFARPGSARLEEVSLEPLLRRAAADPALAGVEVRVDDRCHDAPSRVLGDPQLLERAFRNLLHNAAEAERSAGRSGPVTVRLASAEDGVEIAVEDRGPGLPAEIRDRLFRPFVSHRPGGVGLGLALTHRILELHRGSIRLRDREGGGVRAEIRLPPGAMVTNRNDTVLKKRPGETSKTTSRD